MVVVVGVGLHEAVLAPAQDGLAAERRWFGTSPRQSPFALPQSIVAALQPILHADARDDLAVEAMALPERKPRSFRMVAKSASVCCASRVSTCADRLRGREPALPGR